MSSPRVLMIGYYGRGNYGDDVLMCVTQRILRNIFPSATIYVQAEGDACGYITRLLPDVTLLAPGRHGHFDYIIHGGGGVFSDLQTHPLRIRLREQFLLLFGQRFYLTAERLVRQLLDKSATHCTRRLGLGIGVGRFSPGSPRLRAKLPVIADFSALWVRDAASIAALSAFAPVMKAQMIEGSDLAFLTHFWRPEKIEKPSTPRSKPKLGIALRDWPASLGAPEAELLQQTLATLADEYDITGFIHDAAADAQTTALLAPYPTHIWQPERMGLVEFAAAIGDQDVLLTSRAHGAIIAACMGVPSAVIALEPKLVEIHHMLPEASILVEHQPHLWREAIAKALAIPVAKVDADVARNRAASETALAEIQRWFA